MMFAFKHSVSCFWMFSCYPVQHLSIWWLKIIGPHIFDLRLLTFGSCKCTIFDPFSCTLSIYGITWIAKVISSSFQMVFVVHLVTLHRVLPICSPSSWNMVCWRQWATFLRLGVASPNVQKWTFQMHPFGWMCSTFRLHPWSLTARLWKRVVGRRSFPIGFRSLFRGELLNFRGVLRWFSMVKIPVFFRQKVHALVLGKCHQMSLLFHALHQQKKSLKMSWVDPPKKTWSVTEQH